MSDKYAAFVWPAYAVTALTFIWMVADTLLRARRWRKQAGKQEPPK
ncbi:MAG TPA: heme exporter protein CcmD [Caulobacteraceae bacterium]